MDSSTSAGRPPIRMANMTAQVYDRLAALGIDLPRHIGPIGMHEDTEFEAPCLCSGLFAGGVPTKMGAFSGLVGGIVHASVGRYCSIAAGVVIAPGDHPTDRLTSSWVGYLGEFREWRRLVHGDAVPSVAPLPFVSHRPAIIGNDVWIGANAFIKGGISIGDGAVIAAGSIVVKDVPSYAIVGGNPARIIRFRFSHERIARLTRLRWWRYSYFELQRFQRDNLDEMLDLIEDAVGKSGIAPYEGQRVKLLPFSESGGG